MNELKRHYLRLPHKKISIFSHREKRDDEAKSKIMQMLARETVHLSLWIERSKLHCGKFTILMYIMNYKLEYLNGIIYLPFFELFIIGWFLSNYGNSPGRSGNYVWIILHSANENEQFSFYHKSRNLKLCWVATCDDVCWKARNQTNLAHFVKYVSSIFVSFYFTI